MKPFKDLTSLYGDPLLLNNYNTAFFDEELPEVGRQWIDNDDMFYLSFRDLNKNEFKINSKNYRSDEFIENHDGVHVLFSGCSHALGEGLADKERWSEIVYDKIKTETKCSGYFNIAKMGNSIQACVINIFKYIEKFSKPDVIFFGVPEINRSIIFSKNVQLFKDIIYINKAKLPDNADLYFDSYNYYKILELFCKYNNIELISFDADIQSPQTLSLKKDFVNFNTYHDLNSRVAMEYIHEYSEKNNGKFDIIARDRCHYGLAVNEFIGKELYKIYKEKK